MVTAPPVAQSESRQHGRPSAKLIEIFQTGNILPAIAKEIYIFSPTLPGSNPTVFRKKQRSAVIQDGETLPGNNPVAQRDSAIGLI